MGHVNIVSTQRYLTFIEPLRTAASARFEQKYGASLTEGINNPDSGVLNTGNRTGGAP